MKDSIYKFIKGENVKNGIYIADLPTGYGKTYLTIEAIYRYLKEVGQEKIFFTTTLLKNLPIEDLKKRYIEDRRGEEFSKEVLLIKSNFDYVYENLEKVKVPEEFKECEYRELESQIKMLKNIEKNSLKEFEDGVKNRIREEIEPSFRRYIRHIIKKNLPQSLEEKKAIIKNDKKYKWIGEIYPTVFTSEYKCFFLSIDKFLAKNSVLVEASYSFISEEKIKDSIIIIDEFDSAKKNIEKKIINKMLSANEEYLGLFMELYTVFELHKFPLEIKNLIEKDSTKFSELDNERKEIYNYFKLKYNYKTKTEVIDRGQNFIFNDGSYHTLLRKNKNYIRTKLNEISERVDIYFEDKEEFSKNKSDEDIGMYSLFRRVNGFLGKFKYIVYYWARNYVDEVNEGRGINDEKFTLENAMKTIFNEFGLKNRQIELLISEVDVNLNLLKDEKDIIEDLSFYSSGFKLFEFQDSEEHLTKTMIRYINCNETPEKVLLYLCKIAKVIGISATANIRSVTSNFDLDYLEYELKDNFKIIERDTYKSIKNELSRKWKDYENGEINIDAKVLNENKAQIEVDKRLLDIFGNKRLANKFLNKIKSESYIEKRYCNIFEAIKEFVLNDEIKSFLCLNSIIPKEDMYKFDLKIFKLTLDELVKINNKTNMDLVVLKSENFIADKMNVLRRYSSGEKIFIMSTYKTIGAGQNLQYEPNSIDGLIEIIKLDDTRNRFKDIDGIFLGEITNLFINVYKEEQINKEELLKLLIQLEYLYENNEINYRELDNLVKLAFKKYSGGKQISSLYSKVTEAKSIRREITKEIIQAVGRIGRTHLKNKKICVYTIEEVVSKMDLEIIKDKILSPEMEVLVNLASNFSRRSKEIDEVVNKAEKISLRGRNYIMRMLTKEWNSTSVKLWKNLRECVLKNPTATEKKVLKDKVLERLYISNETDINKYFFLQKGDFSEVSIFFNEDIYKIKSIKNEEENHIYEVSEQAARLEELFKYKGLKEYFKEKKYATKFKKKQIYSKSYFI